MQLRPRKDEFVFDEIDQMYVLQYYVLASAVLLYYDYLLSLRSEVEFIWLRRMTMSSFLFLLNRYIAFFGYIFIMCLNFFPPTNIATLWLIDQAVVIDVHTQLQTLLLFSLRIYALYGRNWKVASPVMLLGLVSVIMSAWTIGDFFGILTNFGLGSSSKSPFIICLPGFETSAIPFEVTIALSTAFDVIVVILTMAKTIRAAQEHRKAGIRDSIYSLLIRDGTIYATVMTIANAINIVFFTSLGNNTTLSHVISVIMTSRLILNLHKVNDKRRKAAVEIRLATLSDSNSHGVRVRDMLERGDNVRSTTYVSSISTWLARAVDDFEGDVMTDTEGIVNHELHHGRFQEKNAS
ncbi:uncharacterized protein FOMMEDRAFT_151559 [Fomitiporia mediterranea MF3/22]|uniref:uncharacterized protein n=1 Tax=Fomitiporia mediterranea (strain MF3/22) TaxID=694068 RepID=UPI0004408D60|nr:uncharacterized protein FOMMEDRAFT_151559 [Fomitiporia mediterranea MF3/22]EJD06324.1 hypothetical protein FOMMEDRAFT_151559 [Fomitiporia mediterranea MF3/22]